MHEWMAPYILSCVVVVFMWHNMENIQTYTKIFSVVFFPLTCIPLGPGMPLGPDSPGSPGNAGSPGAPDSPIRPGAPGGPTGPGEPGGPVSPINDCKKITEQQSYSVQALIPGSFYGPLAHVAPGTQYHIPMLQQYVAWKQITQCSWTSNIFSSKILMAHWPRSLFSNKIAWKQNYTIFMNFKYF